VRASGSNTIEEHFPQDLAMRHIGLYAYRVGALRRFSALPPAPLERCEMLEQLRALSHGLRIKVGVSQAAPPRGVDTEEDLAAVAATLA
jgi:3-deoxy-manno-octulosonate cytidylyltransferase (CMP-KDO synthetase)